MRKIPLLSVLFTGFIMMLAAPSPAPAGVFLSITIAPPALPVYVQPPCPTDGYLWTPGYWAYADAGYYWVPGVWVAPPRVGLLWTPPYWGFAGGFYGFHAGYWGSHVGFYGGINYGFGYGGSGFYGGEWQGGHFAYNTAVVRVNTSVIHNTYNRTENTVVNNRTSFNGPGGTNARPSPQEAAVAREPHVQPTSNQLSHEHAAGADRGQLASVNHGRPATPAAARPMAEPAHANAAPQQNRAAAPVAHAANVSRAPAQERPAQERPAAMNRPAPQARPAAQERPAPQARPAAQARPASNPHPAPQARPENHPQAPRPQAQAQARPQPHEAPHEKR